MAKKKAKRTRARLESNQFVKGLITEASPLTFPKDASLDEENFFLNRDGSRQRRLGMDYEVGYNNIFVQSIDATTADVDTFVWRNASNNRNFNIAVVRVANNFYFFDGDAEIVSASPLNKDTAGIGIPISIEGISIGGIELNVKYDYAFAHGYMVVTSGGQEITIVEYDLENDIISSVNKRLRIRDGFGVELTGLTDLEREPDYRPIGTDPLDVRHHYNLRNQGWLQKLDIFGGVGPTIITDGDTIFQTATDINLFPSNADMVWANKISVGYSIAPDAIGMYDPRELRKATYGKQIAPKGRNIIDIFNRGQNKDEIDFYSRRAIMLREDDTLDVSAIPRDQTQGGVVATTTYVGRIVYAVNEVRIVEGDEHTPSIGSMVFFSKATDNKAGFNKCYAAGDPTSGEEFAPLATDGGWFTITGVGNINNMESIGNSLFIFSDKGIWQVNGGDRLFTATNINVTETTSIGNIGRNATTVVENNVFFLSDAGIYSLPISQEANTSIPENLTQSTIQTFWESIPESNREFIVSSYDRFSRQVKWLIQMEDLPNRNYYDTELIFDLNLKAFFVYKIKTLVSNGGSPYVVGFLERNTVVNVAEENPVVALLEPVIAGIDEVVIEFRKTSEDFITSNKYWNIFDIATSSVSQMTVSEYRELTFRDWGTLVNAAGGKGVDAEAFLLTGYFTGGDSAAFKRANYITTHMRRTEQEIFDFGNNFVVDNPSGCTMQAQWEWTNSASSGRWSNPQQIYKLPRTFIPDEVGEFDYGFTVVTTKNKIRGKGLALSLLFKSEPFKDCHIYGWSLEVNAETEV